jgi:uncharacterized protein (DUF4213/DUF364 family)
VETISYKPGVILRETVEKIRGELGSAIESLTVERVVIGLFFTGVELSNGAGGLCFTPVKSIPESVCCPTSVRAMPDSGKLRGRPALPFVEEMLNGSPLHKALGIAAINALSMTCWKQRQPAAYEIKTGLDAMDEVAIREEDYVIVVGAFVPVLKLLKRRAKPFGILELNPSILYPEELPFLISPEQRDGRIGQADLIIATGTTLINDTLEELLQHRKSCARVVVMGPTASCLPEAFFRRGVNVVGGVRVTDPGRVLDVVAEAGSGFHFFDRGADRIVIQPLSGK